MSRVRGVFVTGTDTSVGKTLVASAIAAWLTARGRRVGVYKPVETGCENRGGERVGSDCEQLRSAAGGRQGRSSVASYLLALPAAPLVAAAAEGVTIDVERLVHDFQSVASAHDFTLVEGAGGLMVPIREGVTYLDLVRRLALPVLVVVGSRLGCINHALLTLGALETAGVGCCGFIVNCLDAATDGPASPSRNRAAITAFARVHDLGIFPYLPAAERSDAAHLADSLPESAHTPIAHLLRENGSDRSRA